MGKDNGRRTERNKDDKNGNDKNNNKG